MVFGSPPRAWRSYVAARDAGNFSRFTPTCVEIMAAGVAAMPCATVHPHVRGDHVAGSRPGRELDGSPPRAWRSSLRWRVGDQANRFTPTCVEIMPPTRLAQPIQSVHPHVRGDHLLRYGQVADHAGSPPRAWRSLLNRLEMHWGIRFTPTCVEIMTSVSASNAVRTVHPHVRGDHHLPVRLHAVDAGSPPRAWRSCRRLIEALGRARFTPTCVEIIHSQQRLERHDAVHPHVRGDHLRRR